jgi:hypothetical protein
MTTGRLGIHFDGFIVWSFFHVNEALNGTKNGQMFPSDVPDFSGDALIDATSG